ncbi:hypothetical protein CMV_014979 [Castanea mollissima]|uniref:Uncharacterized protein n=1 Tax=Castanea mollissima TaxID=60419 RepID=A0A8J4R5X9_9ROSI|nr:hypothetical protein CMV_014979 [Castanea mollissima]
MQLKNTKGKTPVLEICALDKIKSGAIKVVLDIKKFLNDQVELVNGEKLDFDSVGGKWLLATGYHHNVPSWLQVRRKVNSSPRIVFQRHRFQMGGKDIVGSMQIESESSNGSFQVEPYKSYLQLDKTSKGLCILGRLREAEGLLCNTVVRVEPRTYALLLQECIFRIDYKKGRRIHALMVVVGYDPNEYLKTKLLILYVKSGDLGTACVLFDNLQEKSLVSWKAMIAGYVQKVLEEVGLNLYYKMRQTGFIYQTSIPLHQCTELVPL